MRNIFNTQRQFQSVRIKLTVLYLGLCLVLLIVFNISAINAQQHSIQRTTVIVGRGALAHKVAVTTTHTDIITKAFQDRLFSLDLFMAIVAALLSYILSGVTLYPIQESMVRQEEFAADASHELRTPLSIIKSDIDLLKKTETKIPVAYTQTLDSIIEEVDHMDLIIERLLSMVRNPEDKTGAEKYNLYDICKKAYTQMEDIATKKDIELIHVDLKDSLHLPILGQSEQIKEVIIGILDNAIKYTPTGGEIIISAKKDGNTAVVRIADTGIGISEKERSHIFERYYRVDEKQNGDVSTLGNVRGDGLGLSIAKRIIEVAGGRISCEANEPNGTVFLIRLPLFINHTI